MTTSTHLAAFGVTMAQARAFIEANVDNAPLIHSVAREYALSNAMLGEIAGGYTGAQVRAYFSVFGIDSSDLEPTPTALLLAAEGVTMNQARDFLLANVSNPQYIYDVAQMYGLDNAALGEITGYSAAEVAAFFSAAGVGGGGGSGGGGGGGGGGGVILPFLPEELAAVAMQIAPLLIEPNTSSGALSNAALRAGIIDTLGITEQAYLAALDPYKLLELDPTGGLDDSLFDPAVLQQLGLGALASLPPTGATIESLLFGTVINIATSLDEGEAMQLGAFVESNEALLEAMDVGALTSLATLLGNALSTPAAVPLASEAELAEGLVMIGSLLVGVSSGGSLPDLDGLLG